MDSGLKREIEQKVRAGDRLSYDDGVALYDCDDLAWLGGLAHEVRTAENGDVVVFNVNHHLNLTDGCSASCEHCYPQSLRALNEALPDVSLKAFTATEIHWFEKTTGLPADEILDELIDAGLESLTGGGAEIFDWEVRQHIVDHATHWEDWSRIHRLAHSKGLQTPSTMLYGHIEEPRHRVDHILRLRELQDETGGFQVFIPLRYQHDGATPADGKIRNRLAGRTQPTTPAESLTTFAVSRLLFDNVPHVQCLWVLHGLSLAQLSLNFGADDLDGPVVADTITHGADRYGTAGTMHRAELLDLIRDAGFTPVERDTRYEVVRRYEGPTSLAARRREPQPMWS